ncbi:hypothetical protein [Ascidiaceihabitans sp.]|uniref:hypothetical protein n=1 Tax=Ascidiaceihabitans sp. TaxID=1872644 RepID=UPI0032988BB0
MLVFALTLNCLIVFPLTYALLTNNAGMDANQIAIVLFTLQIVYKLATVVAVGPGHAVVQAHIFVVVVLGITLITLLT